jgi:hypothetical protein
MRGFHNETGPAHLKHAMDHTHHLREWLVAVASTSLSLFHISGAQPSNIFEKFVHFMFDKIVFVFEWCVWRPAAHFYLEGPALGGYGFWMGQSPAEICASLTKVSATHWKLTEEGALQCANLIARHFWSLCVGLHIIIYILVIWKSPSMIRWVSGKMVSMFTELLCEKKKIDPQ